jgi:hypothetical protein
MNDQYNALRSISEANADVHLEHLVRLVTRYGKLTPDNAMHGLKLIIMTKSFKAAASLLFLVSAFAWHQRAYQLKPAGHTKEVILYTKIPESSPLSSSDSKIKLPTRNNDQMNARKISEPSAPKSQPQDSCPKENYHEIISHLQKNTWSYCIDMKSSMLLTDGNNTFFRVEIERLSSPLFDGPGEHKFRIVARQVESKESDSGAIVMLENVTTTYENLYSGHLKDFAPESLHDLLSVMYQDKSDIDSLCINSQTREYTRMLTGTLTHPGGRFLSRSEFRIKDGKRMSMLCQGVNSCSCKIQTVKMRRDR